MRSRAACYDELREYVESVPLIDCHDHTSACGPKYEDPAQVVAAGYFTHDLISASSQQDVDVILDVKRPLEERWPLLERAWRRTCHTGYAQVTRRVLKRFYDEDALSLDALKRMRERLVDLTDAARFEAILDEAKIVARLENVHYENEPQPQTDRASGEFPLSPRGRVVIPLPGYHAVCSYEDVQRHVKPLQQNVTSLDEYLVACRANFERYQAGGAVAFKDQSAYTRALDYGNPPRAEAERVFNSFMEDPRRRAAYPDGVRPLDDFLFHEFMRMARDLDLPVQIHTGHMAGIRNDIVKTNASGLTRVLELHRDVRFDLFHANWPYSGEILYLAKNYPNVTIDFCWANIIDPVYCQRMFQQALSSVPHGKIHGYGSDFGGLADRAWAHASIARDNIAIALAELVDADYLGLGEAQEVAHAWLFSNANEFFRLGL